MIFFHHSVGSASSQLFFSWSTDNNTHPIYYRSHREAADWNWSPWRRLAFVDDTVARATADENGNNIAATYATKAEIGDGGTYATGSPSNLKIPVNGTDEQVIIKSGGIQSPNYVTFPEAFPTTCSNVVVTCHTAESCVSAAISDLTRSGFNVRSGTHGGRHEDRSVWVSWIAIGK